MGAGLALDLVVHTVASTGIAVGGFSPGQHAAHLVVLIGMVVMLAAVVVDGTRGGAARARQEGRTRNALR